MSAEGLRRVIIEMIADPELAKRVIADPKSVLEHSGFDVKDLDFEILAKLDSNKLQLKILDPPQGLGYVTLSNVTVT